MENITAIVSAGSEIPWGDLDSESLEGGTDHIAVVEDDCLGQVDNKRLLLAHPTNFHCSLIEAPRPVIQQQLEEFSAVANVTLVSTARDQAGLACTLQLGSAEQASSVHKSSTGGGVVGQGGQGSRRHVVIKPSLVWNFIGRFR